MNENIIDLRKAILQTKISKYELELKRTYLILRRDDIIFGDNVIRYDLFNMNTLETHMEITVFNNINLISVSLLKNNTTCALNFDPNITNAALRNISIVDVKDMISYINFNDLHLYSDDFAEYPGLSQVLDHKLFENFLYLLIDLQYGITSIAKLYIN